MVEDEEMNMDDLFGNQEGTRLAQSPKTGALKNSKAINISASDAVFLSATRAGGDQLDAALSKTPFSAGNRLHGAVFNSLGNTIAQAIASPAIREMLGHAVFAIMLWYSCNGTAAPKNVKDFVGGKDDVVRDQRNMAFKELLPTEALQDAYVATITSFEKHGLLILLQENKRRHGWNDKLDLSVYHPTAR